MQHQIRSIVSILLSSKNDKPIHVTGFKELLDIDISSLKEKDISDIKVIECINNALEAFKGDMIILQLSAGLLIKFVSFDTCASQASKFGIISYLINVFPSIEQEGTTISVLGAIAYLSMTKYDKDKINSISTLTLLNSIITKWYGSEKVLQQFLVLMMSYLSNEKTHSEFVKTNLYDLTYQSITHFPQNQKLFIGFVTSVFSLSSSTIGRVFIMRNNIIPVLSDIASKFPGNKDIALEICKIIFKLNSDPSTREESIKKGCIKTVGQTLMSCLQDKDILTICLQTMRSIASVGKLPVSYMIDCNSIAIIIMCLLAYPSENILILHGLRTISLLIMNGDKNKVVKICIDEGIYKLCATVLSNNTNAEAINATLQLLAVLSSTSNDIEVVKENVISNKIYQIAGNLLVKLVQNDVIIVSVCKFFSCLSNDVEGRSLLIQYNVVKNVLGVLSSSPHTDSAYAAASNLLWKLSIDKSARDIIIQNNGITLILKLLQQYPNFQPIQLSCIGVLNLLSDNNKEVCSSIRKLLGLQYILNSIEQSVDDVNVDLQTISLITNMAALDESCKESLLKKNTIPLFISMLSKHPTHSALAYTVVSALLVLSFEPSGLEQLQSDPDYLSVLQDVFHKLPKASVDLPVQSLIKRIQSTDNFTH